MRNLSRREKIILILTFVVMFVYFIFNNAVKPGLRQISQLDRNIELQDKRLMKNLKTIQQAKELDQALESYKNSYKQTESNDQVMSSILSEIKDVERKLDVRITDVKPNRVKTSEYFNTFSVSLTLDSEISEILKLMYTLQDEPYLFDVSEVRFDKTTSRNIKTIQTRIVLSKIFIP